MDVTTNAHGAGVFASLPLRSTESPVRTGLGRRAVRVPTGSLTQSPKAQSTRDSEAPRLLGPFVAQTRLIGRNRRGLWFEFVRFSWTDMPYAVVSEAR